MLSLSYSTKENMSIDLLNYFDFSVIMEPHQSLQRGQDIYSPNKRYYLHSAIERFGILTVGARNLASIYSFAASWHIKMRKKFGV